MANFLQKYEFRCTVQFLAKIPKGTLADPGCPGVGCIFNTIFDPMGLPKYTWARIPNTNYTMLVIIIILIYN